MRVHVKCQMKYSISNSMWHHDWITYRLHDLVWATHNSVFASRVVQSQRKLPGDSGPPLIFISREIFNSTSSPCCWWIEKNPISEIYKLSSVKQENNFGFGEESFLIKTRKKQLKLSSSLRNSPSIDSRVRSQSSPSSLEAASAALKLNLHGCFLTFYQLTADIHSLLFPSLELSSQI